MTKPTLKTIAQLSGMAVPTVSRALGDAPDISAATKQKVRRIADEIGYVPNRAGVRLRTGRTNVISVAMSTENEMMNLTARLTASIAKGLVGTRYHLNITHYFPGEDPMKPIRYLVETGSADAVIFNAVRPDDMRVAYLRDKGFPFAMHGRTGADEVNAYFDYDNAAFARLAVSELTKRNRRSILFIHPPQHEFYGQEMLRGATEACAAAGVELILSGDVNSDSRIDEISALTTRMIAQNPQIDGVLAPTPNAAMAATAGLEAQGRTLNTNMDLVAKDAVSFLTLFRREIIIIREDVDQAGSFLARAAIHAIAAPDAPRMQELDIPTPP